MFYFLIERKRFTAISCVESAQSGPGDIDTLVGECRDGVSASFEARMFR
jgi:hypothetical protein